MNKLAGLVTLCLILAIIRAALIALVVALLLGFVVLFITRPKDTLVLLGAFTLMGLANAHPIACIAGLALIGVAGVVAKAKQKSIGLRTLTDDRDHQPNHSEG